MVSARESVIYSFNIGIQQKTHLQEYSRKPQQYQEGPVRSLHNKTDSQSVSRGVIWSLTAKGVGLSVTVPKGVTTSLDTRQHHHDTERRPVVAVPEACRSIVRHRSSVPLARCEHLAKPSHRPRRQQTRQCRLLPVFHTRRRTPHSSSTLIRSRPTASPDTITQTSHYVLHAITVRQTK